MNTNAKIFHDIKQLRPELFVMNSSRRKYSNNFIFYAFHNNIMDLDKPEQIYGIWDREEGRIIRSDITNYKEISTLFKPSSRNVEVNGVFSNFIYRYGFDILFPELLNISTRQEFYDVLNPVVCKVCHNTFKRGPKDKYSSGRKTCSVECESTGHSRTFQQINATRTPELNAQIKKKQSTTMKRLILEGKFTPGVTNSWARSRCYVSGIPFRSSWESLFWIVNQDCEFETIRIPYTYNGSNHSYIIDFVDKENNILYEIKPEGLTNGEKVKAKEEAAEKWCEDNGYEFRFISEDYFKENIQSIETVFYNLSSSLDYRTAKLMKRNIIKFKVN